MKNISVDAGALTRSLNMAELPDELDAKICSLLLFGKKHSPDDGFVDLMLDPEKDSVALVLLRRLGVNV